LTEVGVIAAQGPRHARELAELIEACDETIPFEVCEALAPLLVQLRNLDEAIARLDRTIAKLAQKDETARRLMSIPGFGPVTASAMAATIQDTSSFAGPREFAAFLGLTPKQNSSGGKPKLGRISKMGNRNSRKLHTTASALSCWASVRPGTSIRARSGSTRKSHLVVVTKSPQTASTSAIDSQLPCELLVAYCRTMRGEQLSHRATVAASTEMSTYVTASFAILPPSVMRVRLLIVELIVRKTELKMPFRRTAAAHAGTPCAIATSAPARTRYREAGLRRRRARSPRSCRRTPRCPRRAG
jgi:Transposase IS116/IS110/IS902 family